jgi:hypothetical protein
MVRARGVRLRRLRRRRTWFSWYATAWTGTVRDMTLRRRKSKKAQAADVLGNYLKLKAAGKAAKGARKAAEGTAVVKAAKHTPKKVPLLAAGAAAVTAAAIVAVKAIRGGGDGSQPASA